MEGRGEVWEDEVGGEKEEEEEEEVEEEDRVRAPVEDFKVVGIVSKSNGGDDFTHSFRHTKL